MFDRICVEMRGLFSAVLFLPALITGCSAPMTPDLQRLYASSQSRARQPPIVIVPGLMGSKLRDRDTEREVWPGTSVDLLFGARGAFALEIDPGTLEPLPSRIEASDITDRAAGKDYYHSILRVLEEAGGYVRAEPGDPILPDRRHYYVFAYDWRQDNALSARKLSYFIERIRADHRDPGLKVDIVAHSMGGLITRYYLRYGEVDTLDDNDFPVTMAGARRVRRVVLLGTPNLGSVEALKSLIAGRKIGWTRVPPEVLATMPSMYQLLPHAITDWLVTTQGRMLAWDQFDVEIWRRFQWAVFDPRERARIRSHFPMEQDADAYLATLERFFEKRLERARRFLWSLTVPVSDPLPLIVFGGDCDLTPARLVVEEVKSESLLRLFPDEIGDPVPGVDYDALMLEPGDGLVTKASLLGKDVLDPTVPRHKWSFFPLDYSFFLCQRHDTLTTNPSFQDNLLHALLSADERFRVGSNPHQRKQP